MNTHNQREAARSTDLRTLYAIARRNQAALRGAFVFFMAMLLAIGGIAMGAAPVTADAAQGRAKITAVPESEFEPLGYEASLDFDGIEVIRGFQKVSDVGVYYDHRDFGTTGPDNHYLQVKGKPGYAFAINASTPKSAPSLRYTGGVYNNVEYDAIVTIEDWTYLEPSVGWENYSPYYEAHEVFQPGVYVSEGWKSLSDGDTGFQNFNFYTVGLSDIKVSVQFVYAHTDTPVEVKGHATCIDLDTMQALEFGGAIENARIVSDNKHLTLANDATRACSSTTPLSTDGWNRPEEYKIGLVETFYDTTGDNLGKPAEVYFFPGWNQAEIDADRWSDPQSFFALTPDFLTAPNPDENPNGQTEITKSADKTEGVSIDDEVEYTVDFKAHEQGVNCRIGYQYTALDIIDTLPAEMRYVDGSGYLADESGRRLEGAGTVTYEGNNENPTENTVRFEFDKAFLANMPMKGEHYRFVFKAELTEYPADGSLSVRNGSYALINAKGKVPSNYVDVKLVEPVFSVDKTADAYEYQANDTIRYTVVYKQTAENAQARETVVADNLPEGLELVADSVKASGIADLPAPKVEGNAWSYTFDKFNYGDTLTVTYQARATQSGDGQEIVNNASIHANNAQDADDPAEVWINTAALDIDKTVDRYEGYVGASDQDPGFFEYTVEVANTKKGTVANDVVITDDSLPEGMPVGRNSDGSMMVSVSANDGSDASMTWDKDEATGAFATIAYPVGDEDDTHGQTADTPVVWTLEPASTGWKLAIDHLVYGAEVTLVFRVYPDDSVSGWEIVNEADAEARNAETVADRAKVWVNQPHLAVDKKANLDSFTVGDHIVYRATIANSTPGTFGRNLVFSDLARTEGIDLLASSIKVFDSKGRDITDSCTVTTRFGQKSFIVETHRNIVNGSGAYTRWENGAETTVDKENPLNEGGETQVTVEYEIAVSDAELAGSSIDNTALGVTDEPNTSTTDDETVEIKGPKLAVDKTSDKRSYEAGETAHYELLVTQTREDVTARNIVLKDLMDDPGIGKIVEGSISATGPDGKAIEAKPVYTVDDEKRIVGFELATGAALADEETIRVTYDAVMLAEGATLGNKVQASADNAIGATDAHEVETTKPATPDEPDEPSKPDTPDEPDDPKDPEDPQEPSDPDAPDEPSTPDSPDEPNDPQEPTEPTEPDEPSDQDEPVIAPDKPAKPETPAAGVAQAIAKTSDVIGAFVFPMALGCLAAAAGGIAFFAAKRIRAKN